MALSKGFDTDIPVCDRTVIALKHERAGYRFIVVCTGSGRTSDSNVFMD
jgi:hypothetical protein